MRNGAWVLAIVAVATVAAIAQGNRGNDTASDLPRPSAAFCKAAAKYDKTTTAKTIPLRRHVELTNAIAVAAPKDAKRDANLVWQSFVKLRRRPQRGRQRPREGRARPREPSRRPGLRVVPARQRDVTVGPPRGVLVGHRRVVDAVRGGGARVGLVPGGASAARTRRAATATDSRTRYAEDFALYAEHGLTHHRLSIEWARIEPEPKAAATPTAVEHYRAVLQAARGRGRVAVGLPAPLHPAGLVHRDR